MTRPAIVPADVRVAALINVLPNDMAEKYDNALKRIAVMEKQIENKGGLAVNDPGKDDPSKSKGPRG